MGKSANLLCAGVKLAFNATGPVSKPEGGETVCAIRSPTPGIVGSDLGSTSRRAVP